MVSIAGVGLLFRRPLLVNSSQDGLCFLVTSRDVSKDLYNKYSKIQ